MATQAMDKHKSYTRLMGGNANDPLIDEAVTYYLENYQDMNKSYPKLLENIKNNANIQKKVQEGYVKLSVKSTVYNDHFDKNGSIAQDIYPKNFFGSLDMGTGTTDADNPGVKETIIKEELEDLLGNSMVNMTDQDNFSLPDMGDYYIGNIDNTILENIDKIYRGTKDAHKAIHYATTAPQEHLGYDEDAGTYFLKAKADLTEDDILNGSMGVDFLTLSTDQLSAGSYKESLKDFKDLISAKTNNIDSISGTKAGNMFELKIMGITAPALPRWCIEKDIPMTELKIVTKPYEEIKDDPNYVTMKTEGDIQFVLIGNKYHEYESVLEEQDNIEAPDNSGYHPKVFRWLLSPGDQGTAKNQDNKEYNKYAASLEAAKTLLKKIQDAEGEIYIRFESCGLKEGSPTFPATYPSPTEEENTQLQSWAQHAGTGVSYTGLNRINLENNRRFLGEVYIKTPSEYGEVFVNLSKLIANDETANLDGISPNTLYEGNNSFAFDTAGYDIDSKWYADAFFKTLSELDDRPQIQKTLTGKEWNHMRTWNVTIGDCTFFVPPINIRLQTQTQSQRLSLLRSRGSAVKTGSYIDRILAMDIYFNEDRGINGAAYAAELKDKDKTKITYAMNGLRALMAQFRFTPFLPIENDFINRHLGIDAVIVKGLSIQSIPNFPKLIHATLTVQEFDWRVYMPDICQMAETVTGYQENKDLTMPDNRSEEEEAVDDVADAIEGEDGLTVEERVKTELGIEEELKTNFAAEYKNWFSASINWQVFRYYYQRPIRRGDFLSMRKWDFNSDEFIQVTCGGLTSYMPMEFQDPSIHFYMANEDYMKRLLEQRLSALQNGGFANTTMKFSENQLKLLEEMGKFYDALTEVQKSDEYKAALKDLNDYVLKTPPPFSPTADVPNNNFGMGTYYYINADGVRNAMGAGNEFAAKMNKVLDIIQTGTSDTRTADVFLPTHQYISCFNKNRDTVTFGLALTISGSLLSTTDMDQFKRNVKEFIGYDPTQEEENWPGPFDNLFSSTNNKIVIPVSIPVEVSIMNYYPDSNAVFALSTDTPGMQLLKIAKYIHEKYKDGDDGHPSITSLMNLKYDKYNVDDILVINWSAQMTNRTADIRVINSGICAPQYLGGEDIVIDLTIKTTNGAAAAMLTAIPKQLTRLTRTYHTVIPCVPLRIDSEFSKFIGVHEVSCEDCYIETEEDYPGVYLVRMRLISLDRTIREKEAAVRMAANNAGYHYTDNDEISGYGAAELAGAGVGAILGAGYAISAGAVLSLTGAGAVMAGAAIGALPFAIAGGLLYGGYTLLKGAEKSFGGGTEQRQRYRHYFEMKKALGEVDLYPDLELPTLVEMYAVGMYFTRYKFQDERMYVDPDFYFVYPVKLSSALYREMAIKGMDEGIADTKLTDATGASMDIKPAKYTGYQAVTMNPICSGQVVTAQDLKKKVQSLKQETVKNDQKNNLTHYDTITRPLLSYLNSNIEKEYWGICKDIRTMFLEKKYKTEIASYLAREKADSIGNTGGKTQGFTEGKWAHDVLSGVQKAADDFYVELQNSTIETMFPSMAGTADEFYSNFSKISGEKMLGQVESAVAAFLGVKEVQDFLMDLKIDITDKFKEIFANIVKAAVCAATGKKEYAAKRFSTDWKPYPDYIGVKMGGTQNANQTSEVWWSDPVKDKKELYNIVVKCGIRFGCFAISMYTREDLQRLLADWEPLLSEWKEPDPEIGNVNYFLFLLDPGYRKVDHTTIELYKAKCITSVAYCTYAYCRLIMYWLVRMVKDYLIPNICTDIFRKLSSLEKNIEDTQNQYIPGAGTVMLSSQDGTLRALQQYIDFYNKNTHVLDSGKIWAAAIMASSENDLSLYKNMMNHDYDGLNAIVDSCISPVTRYDSQQNKGKMALRKMSLALVGLGVIDDINAFGVSPTSPAVAASRETFQKRYLDAAEDPTKFIPHSYHDMIVYDARGRMLRAFPTFYLTFIDEGREIGFWKLHDNFYSNSAIMEIEVIKSRKLPTDVCNITMSNFYRSFQTEQEDYIKTPVATFDDAWNSIFSVREYWESQEVARSNKPQEVRLRLRPGARIHVRMGYGNNVNMLPIVFNGVIAEVNSEDTVQIIAQGDGVELLNPIGIDKEAQNLDTMSDFFDSIDNGITPLQAASNLFTAYAGVFSEAIRKRLKLNLVSRNAFGIVHFGDPDFTMFCKSGETCQNLYEVSEEVINGENNNIKSITYAMDKLQFSCDMFQKTPWDILNICKSLSPDFRLAVLPFGFRSTCFMGKPHYYYCYEYVKDSEGIVQEKRKPFQQWHIYTSEQDIIGNGIAATNRDVKTVAVGLFQVYDIANTRTQKTVGPLYADWDIYNECQKTMLVDTSLLGKGAIPVVQAVTNFIRARDWFDKIFDETGPVASHHKIAWRATASALRESVQEMYAGDLIIFGDPSLKPQDRLYIADKYTMISGQVLAREVVHRISVDGGFTTSVSPDCIAAVNDNTELIKYMNLERVGALSSLATSMIYEKSVAEHTMPWIVRQAISGTVMGTLGYGGYKLLGGTLLKKFTNQGAIKTVTEYGGKAIKFTGKQISSMLSKASAASGIVSKVATAGRTVLGLAGRALGSLNPIVAAGMLATTLFQTFVCPEIAEFIRNFKVIKIYPLKKFGYALTAGFEGARGTVYGSPTWGDRGTLGDIMDEFPILTDVFLFMASDEVNEEAQKYLKENAIINEQGNPAAAETQFGKTAAYLAGQTFAYGANNYRSMMITPRAVNSNARDVLNSYNHFKVMDINHYKEDPKFNNLRVISQDSRIVPYIDEQFFVVIHDDPGLPVGDSVMEDILTIGGEKHRTKVIVTKDNKGNTVLDIPVLHSDAINILYELIRRTKLYMPSANATDKQEAFENSKTDYLVLKGALRVGDQGSQAATGFMFTLAGTSENSQRALLAAIKDIEQELQEFNIDKDKKFLYYQQKNHEIVFSIAMPIVSDSGEDSDDTEEKAEDTGQKSEEENSEEEILQEESDAEQEEEGKNEAEKDGKET